MALKPAAKKASSPGKTILAVVLCVVALGVIGWNLFGRGAPPPAPTTPPDPNRAPRQVGPMIPPPEEGKAPAEQPR